MLVSDVTKVGVTWCCVTFLPQKWWLISHRPQKWKRDDFLLVPVIILQITVNTRTLSAFPEDRLSSVLVNSYAEIFRFSLRCHSLYGVTRSVGPSQFPLPPLVTPPNSRSLSSRPAGDITSI